MERLRLPLSILHCHMDQVRGYCRNIHNKQASANKSVYLFCEFSVHVLVFVHRIQLWTMNFHSGSIVIVSVFCNMFEMCMLLLLPISTFMTPNIENRFQPYHKSWSMRLIHIVYIQNKYLWRNGQTTDSRLHDDVQVERWNVYRRSR